MNGQKHYKLALFIGRFQPFHEGHLYSLRKAIGVAERVIIGIGSSNIQDRKNPWNFDSRKQMVQSVIKNLDWGRSIQAIWAVPDLYNSEQWGNMIVSRVRKEGVFESEVVAVGNNEWTNRIMRMKKIDVVEPGLLRRDELEGALIREFVENNDVSWKDRVPLPVIECILRSRRH